MKYSETKKLFYGKYLYKCTIVTPLAYYFYKITHFDKMIAALNAAIADAETQINDKKLSKNSATIAVVKRWHRKYEVTQSHLDQMKMVSNLFVEFYGEYRTRTEMNNLSLYTNDENLIEKLEKTIDSQEIGIEFFKPSSLAKNILLGDKEIYVVNKPSEYQFRLTVYGRMNNSKELAKWLESNKDKVKASSTAIRGFKAEYWLSSLLFYVRDEKVLMLAQMMFGDNIKKVEKIVFVGNSTTEEEENT